MGLRYLAHTRKKILIFQMNFWLKAARTSRLEKIGNLEYVKIRIRKIMEVQIDVFQAIELNGLKWYGYGHRMSHAFLRKVFIDWN